MHKSHAFKAAAYTVIDRRRQRLSSAKKAMETPVMPLPEPDPSCTCKCHFRVEKWEGPVSRQSHIPMQFQAFACNRCNLITITTTTTTTTITTTMTMIALVTDGFYVHSSL